MAYFLKKVSIEEKLTVFSILTLEENKYGLRSPGLRRSPVLRAERANICFFFFFTPPKGRYFTMSQFRGHLSQGNRATISKEKGSNV